MAYCGEQDGGKAGEARWRNTAGRSTLDYRVPEPFALRSHGGAALCEKAAFPEAMVCAKPSLQRNPEATQCQEAHKGAGRSGAGTIRSGQATWRYPVDGLAVDSDLGGWRRGVAGETRYLVALETKGHTDCSMSYCSGAVQASFLPAKAPGCWRHQSMYIPRYSKITAMPWSR